MSERFKEPVLKTGDGATHREFESHTLRQNRVAWWRPGFYFAFLETTWKVGVLYNYLEWLQCVGVPRKGRENPEMTVESFRVSGSVLGRLLLCMEILQLFPPRAASFPPCDLPGVLSISLLLRLIRQYFCGLQLGILMSRVQQKRN